MTLAEPMSRALGMSVEPTRSEALLVRPWAAEILAALRADPAVREAIADTLMDLRMDGPWSQGTRMTYQEAMRHYADVLLDALLGAQPDSTGARE
jgi:hypothetical protein